MPARFEFHEIGRTAEAGRLFVTQIDRQIDEVRANLQKLERLRKEACETLAINDNTGTVDTAFRRLVPRDDRDQEKGK